MLNIQELEKALEKYEEVQKQYSDFVGQFLLKMAYKTLAKTKKLTPVDTGNLRNRWEISNIIRNGENLEVSIFNSVDYASFVEYGHLQKERWVPGIWKNGRFEYIKGHKQGMKLKTKWIEGHFMATLSIKEIERILPKQYEMTFKKWLGGIA